MTINEILANEELRQHEFPVTRRKVFLAHAAVCPLPRRVSEAIQKCAAQGVEDDQELAFRHAQIQKARQLGAQLLGAEAGGNRLRRANVAGLEFCGRRSALAQGRQYSCLLR